MFILDASVALSHCLGETEFRDQARRVMAAFGAETAMVPAIWSIELANALRQKERGKVVTRREVDELLLRWGAMPLAVDTGGLSVTFGDTVRLARKHDLSVYDASYLELAVRQKAPLATFDAALGAAARREGAALFDGASAG